MNRCHSFSISIFFFLFLTKIAFAETIEQDTLPVLEPEQKHHLQTKAIKSLLSQYHYRKQRLNDSISNQIFSNYLSSLDHYKLYLLKHDIEYFKKYESELDNHIQSAQLDVAYQIFLKYRERALTRMKKVFKTIEKGFDFSTEEYYDPDAERKDWAKDESEMDLRWSKLLKMQALNLKLAQKDSAKIIDILLKRYEQTERHIAQNNSEDVYSLFINSFTSVFDPHTNYFSPMNSENFKINMSLSLEGIGARLQQQVEYTVIYEVIAGGPASKTQGLNKDDKIVGVGQGIDGEFEDVVGWRIDDVVQKIRGPKGTIVRLLILKSGDSPATLPDTVEIIRDKIQLEEQAAKSQVYPIQNEGEDYTLGVINVRSFYLDFDGRRRGLPDYKSTTRDVKNLITELKENNKIDGLVVDLRYNGGGSLEEAINLTGLFIPGGPVVQVKNTQGNIEVHRDRDYSVHYDGPLFVLVNRYSASASEIFSGAIQDYGRGIIIGENTFGKGTVQQLLPLERYVSSKERLGQVKLTLAKFYRVTGSSTQNLGVIPDIEFPMPFDAAEIGESSRKNALPWDKITSSDFNETKDVSSRTIKRLIDTFQQDLQEDEDLKAWHSNILEAREDSDKKISLNYDKRFNKMEKARTKKEMSEDKKGVFSKKEVQFVSEDKDEIEKLSSDLFLKESLKLLTDYIKLS